MAKAYVGTLLGMASSSPSNTVSSDITYEQAAAFHSTVFSNNGLSLDAWTLASPGKVLDPQSMQSLWQLIIGPDSATSNHGSAEVYSIMSLIGGVGTPDAPANLSDESVTAANWTNNVMAAGLTSVFVGSHACTIGAITVDDQAGDAITTQVGDSSEANGSYALSTVGNIAYFEGSGASLALSNASLTLDNGASLTVLGFR